MTSAALAQLVNTAGQLHGAGRVAEAEQLYRQVLAADPRRLDAMCGLGLIASQMGRHEEALRLLRFEVVSRAGNPLLLVALSASRLAAGGEGATEGAVDCARRAIAIDSTFADAHNNLGCALLALGKLGEAASAFRAAIANRAAYPEAHFNLGRALYDAGSLADAVIAYRTALAQRPGYVGAWFNLGFALRKQGLLDEAAAAFGQAIALKPGFSEALHNLGVTLAEKGQVREAAEWHQKAVAANPNNMQAHSGLMYLLQFHPDATRRMMVEEAARWDRQHAAPLLPGRVVHANDRSPERRLRVGYVSPDFYAHAQCRFTVPLFAAHDHERFEIHGYSSVIKPDHITELIRNEMDVWHEVRGLSDAALTEKIRADGIDILIDLSMHMENHRLLAFARKPAPVQMSWLAYPTCPGLRAIDYRITDVCLDPPELLPAPDFPQRPIYIPRLNCCYHPVTEMPEVGPLPAERSGGITFGSLNNFRKMSPPVLELWAEVLRELPESRLIMLCPPGDHRAAALGVFQRRGVDASRITLLTHLPGPEYLRKYGEIDIALDPFPYNGITTTLDALWMGVPVLTLAGETAPSRASKAILDALGLSEWVCGSHTEFIARARVLAKDMPRLAELRSSLRQRMADSVVMDGAGFARKMETAYREAWRAWSAGP